MAKGDGIKYYSKMIIKSKKLLQEAFLKNPKEPPFPPEGMSWQEIVDEAIRREK